MWKRKTYDGKWPAFSSGRRNLSSYCIRAKIFIKLGRQHYDENACVNVGRAASKARGMKLILSTTTNCSATEENHGKASPRRFQS
jgi:hypothetical protein